MGRPESPNFLLDHVPPDKNFVNSNTSITTHKNRDSEWIKLASKNKRPSHNINQSKNPKEKLSVDTREQGKNHRVFFNDEQLTTRFDRLKDEPTDSPKTFADYKARTKFCFVKQVKPNLYKAQQQPCTSEKITTKIEAKPLSQKQPRNTFQCHHLNKKYDMGKHTHIPTLMGTHNISQQQTFKAHYPCPIIIHNPPQHAYIVDATPPISRRSATRFARAGSRSRAASGCSSAFHGTPVRFRDEGDIYYHHCMKTAELVAAELGLSDNAWLVTFQSRFGREEWLQPYTDVTLQSLTKAGIKHLDIICPGFSADCLENA